MAEARASCSQAFARLGLGFSCGEHSVARIFISHSSHNNERAIQVLDWLRANGGEDVFLNEDPERGIAVGERWKEALPKATQHCEAILALLSPEWLASPRGRSASSCTTCIASTNRVLWVWLG
jgi:hypothetical protein